MPNHYLMYKKLLIGVRHTVPVRVPNELV
jgi:hypothetical protein